MGWLSIINSVTNISRLDTFKDDLRRGNRILISFLEGNLKGEDATALNIKYPMHSY